MPVISVTQEAEVAVSRDRAITLWHGDRARLRLKKEVFMFEGIFNAFKELLSFEIVILRI